MVRAKIRESGSSASCCLSVQVPDGAPAQVLPGGPTFERSIAVLVISRKYWNTDDLVAFYNAGAGGTLPLN